MQCIRAVISSLYYCNTVSSNDMCMLNRYNKTCVQQINRHLHFNANRLSQNCFPDCLINLTTCTAISRKDVRKSTRNNPQRYCGWFWAHCSSKIIICKNGTRGNGLAIAKRKQQKVSAVSGTVYWSYPILPFGIVAYRFFLTTFLEIAV